MRISLFIILAIIRVEAVCQAINNEITLIQYERKENLMAVAYRDNRIEIYDLKDSIHLAGSTEGIKQSSDTKENAIICINFLENTNKLFVLYNYNRIAFLNYDCSILISNNIHIDLMHDSPFGDEIIRLSAYSVNNNLLAIAGYDEQTIVLIDLYKLYYLCEIKYTPSIITRKYKVKELNDIGYVLTSPSFEEIHKSVVGNLSILTYPPKTFFTSIKISPDARYVVAANNLKKIYKWTLYTDSQSKQITNDVPGFYSNSKKSVLDRVLSKPNPYQIKAEQTLEPSAYVNIYYHDEQTIEPTVTLAINDSLTFSASNPNSKYGNLQFWDNPNYYITQYINDTTTYKQVTLSEDGNFAIAINNSSCILFVKKENGNYAPGFHIKSNNLHYPQSKITTSQFIDNNTIAIADTANVYFYQLPSLQFLYALKSAKSKLKIDLIP